MNKKLLRTRKDNVLSGVCGGIANYFNVDVTIIRILWVISSLIGGIGLGTYILCAIIIPKEPLDERENFDRSDDDRYENDGFDFEEKENYDDEEKDERNKKYLGLGFIALGALLTFKVMFPNFSFKFFWPIALVGVGLLLLNRPDKNEEE